MKHTYHACHWPGCDVEVAPRLWGCRKHWFALPAKIRALIWDAYVPGQEVSKTPSPRYVKVAAIAQSWIQAHLAGNVPPEWDRLVVSGDVEHQEAHVEARKAEDARIAARFAALPPGPGPSGIYPHVCAWPFRDPEPPLPPMMRQTFDGSWVRPGE